MSSAARLLCMALLVLIMGAVRADAVAATIVVRDGADEPRSDPVVVFVIEVPPSTPTDAEVWLAGDRVELGSWNGHGLRAEKAGPFEYRASQAFPDGTVFQFKVTRGSWDTVEKGAGGEEVANRTFHVDGPETARIVVASWRDQAESQERTATLSGDIRRHEKFPSAFVSDRDVLVYLPPSYDVQLDQRYPVLYMHDGQNIFDQASSFLGVEWGVDETAERLIGEGRIEPLIVVGVYNSGTGRVYDYTPDTAPVDDVSANGGAFPVDDVSANGGASPVDDVSANGGASPVDDVSAHAPSFPAGRRFGADTDVRRKLQEDAGGGADAYGRFLIDELKPFIDATYRTKSGREDTGIAGSSLGGLVSLYLGLELEDRFGRLAAVSPSVWWANGHILDFVRTVGHQDVRIWLDMGASESPTALEQARALRDVLTDVGWVEGRDLGYMEAPGAPHNEGAWADRIDEILEFLYPPR